MDNITVGLLLTKLNMGIHRFALSELSEFEDDSSSYNAKREVAELLREGFIYADGHKSYIIDVDLYTLRKHYLRSFSKEREPADVDIKCRFDRCDIINSVWRVKDVSTMTEDDRDVFEGVEETDRCSREYLDRRRRWVQQYSPKTDDDDDDEDDNEEDEDSDLNRRRREYLEKRRRELIAELQEEANTENETDEEDEDDEDDTESGDGENSEYDGLDGELYMDETSETEESGEELRKRLCALLCEGGIRGETMVPALQLCASKGYVSSQLLQSNMNIKGYFADYVCFWLWKNHFTKRDVRDDEKYVLNMPVSQFLSCCRETEERKKSIESLAIVLKNIGAKKERGEERKQTILQRYAEDFRYGKIVREKILKLLRDEPTMTRTKAIAKAEGCLFAAREMDRAISAETYEKVISALKGMSNYKFNRLKGEVKE